MLTIGRQTHGNIVTLCKQSCAAQVHAFGQIRCRGWSSTARRDTTAQSTGLVLVGRSHKSKEAVSGLLLCWLFMSGGCIAGVADHFHPDYFLHVLVDVFARSALHLGTFSCNLIVRR